MPCIKIGINMAGAISAGAYTAGVLDFLTEALDCWEEAKRNGETVPMHDVSIEVLSGASAGGMCAAIAALMLQHDFEHIRDVTKTGTTNRLYESWVNRIDIRELLKSDDLRNASQVNSLLDSTIIGNIAAFALTPGAAPVKRRSYVSPDLTLYLSLTNLRGTPYSLNGEAPGSIEETTFFYGDRIRFEIKASSTAASAAKPGTYWLDPTNNNGAGWQTLQTAAMATGAFPIFLAPRILTRSLSEYTPPVWESVTAAATGNPPPVSPDFPPGTPDPLHTLNVDGGMTNNDPFVYAHDHLAKLTPPKDTPAIRGEDVDRAVINIAPFPTTTLFDLKYDLARAAGILPILGKLFSALLSQSRFFGESLTSVMRGTSFDRFVIAPSDEELVQEFKGQPADRHPPALQCGTLGAFGGFFCRDFRAHDYALGRRNCQKFLRDSFLLPQDNAIISAGLQKSGVDPHAIGRSRPRAYSVAKEAPPAGDSAADAATAKKWIPVIPLYGAAAEEIPRPRRAKITGDMLDEILDLVMQRFRAVVAVLLSRVPSAPLRLFLRVGQPFIRSMARRPVRDTLIRGFGDSYEA